jgi:hypothetical protein
MKCPKCKSRIGLQYHERALLERGYAQGICCFICGLWVNGFEQEALGSLNKLRSH